MSTQPSPAPPVLDKKGEDAVKEFQQILACKDLDYARHKLQKLEENIMSLKQSTADIVASRLNIEKIHAAVMATKKAQVEDNEKAIVRLEAVVAAIKPLMTAPGKPESRKKK